MDQRRTPEPSLDPTRLEEGLQRLRALGYLQSPAEVYLARRVGIRASTGRTALAIGVWVGGGLGVLTSIFLIVSAVLSEPQLIGRPEILLTLWLELLVVLFVAGALGTGLAAASVLLGRGRRHGFALARFEVLVVGIPALASALYLGDRMGRTLTLETAGPIWWVGAIVVALLVGAVAAAVAWSVSAAIALARMYASGIEQPLALTRGQRSTPWALLSAATLALLVVGPYRGYAPLPLLDEVVPPVAAAPRALMVVTVDGVEDPAWLGASDVVGVAQAERGAEHPAAYWNEFATGFGAREHGVAGAAAAGVRGWEEGVGGMAEDPLLDVLLRHLLPGVGLGETIAADRRDLRRPPVWEIAAVAGRRTRAVNCWSTYPAARRDGLEVLSDRAFLRHFDGAAADSFVIWPPSFARDAETLRWDALQTKRSTLPGYAEGENWLRSRAAADTALARIWELATMADVYHLAWATRDLDATLGPTLVVVHLNGLDIVVRALQRRPHLDGSGLLDAMATFVSSAVAEHRPPPEYQVVTVARAAVRPGEIPRAWAWGGGDLPRHPRAWASWLLWSQGVVPARDLMLPESISSSMAASDRPETFGRLQGGGTGGTRSGADLERLRSLGYIGG